MTNIFYEQQHFYQSNVTQSISWRKEQLRRLDEAIVKYENEIFDAFILDLKKPKFEVIATETGIVRQSIRHTLKHIDDWTRKENIKTPYFIAGRKSYTVKEPMGNVLIMSPFNYPFQLVMEPLIAAISAGNTAHILASEYTPNVNQVIKEILTSIFPTSFVYFEEGNKEINSEVLNLPFDLIFFTGSPTVGKAVMKKAAENLTPVVLELGGKSPAIIMDDAKLDVIVDRLVWGKFVNTGQTCIAPDYLIVDEKIVDLLIPKIKATIKKFYGENPQKSKDYGRIVNEKHSLRLQEYIEENLSSIVIGGAYDGSYIEPTVMYASKYNGLVMEEEIFGPILPIITYKEEIEIEQIIAQHKNPLALYIFTEDDQKAEQYLKRIPFGGGMQNDAIYHFANFNLPFGGRGNSGMGHYHGKYNIDAFSHTKSIMTAGTGFNIKYLFPPYRRKSKLLKKFFK